MIRFEIFYTDGSMARGSTLDKWLQCPNDFVQVVVTLDSESPKCPDVQFGYDYFYYPKWGQNRKVGALMADEAFYRLLWASIDRSQLVDRSYVHIFEENYNAEWECEKRPE